MARGNILKFKLNTLKTKLRFYPNNIANQINFYNSLEKNRIKNTIISMTSFPSRHAATLKTLKSLLNQNQLPEMICLYINESQYNQSQLSDIYSLDADLISVRFVSEDHKSYNKLIYAYHDFPANTIVTCDDDVLYPTYWLTELATASHANPGCIISTRARQMEHDAAGILTPYSSWSHATHTRPSLSLLPLGVGGVLYPPKSLSNMVGQSDLFLNLCPKADDLWFKLMSFLNRTPIVQTKTKPSRYADIPIGSGPTLASYNIHNLGNDEQINNLISYFDINAKEISNMKI